MLTFYGAAADSGGSAAHKSPPQASQLYQDLLLQVVEALQQTGAALITIHGRTMQQGYRKAADWDLIEQAAAASTIPIVGNGDVLTYYEVGTSGCMN